MNQKNIDPKEVFGRDAENYDHNRIAYPPEFVSQILDSAFHDAARSSIKKRPHNPCVIDIGAGTGKLGGVLLQLGCRTIFVEPNPQLVRFLQSHFGQNPEAKIVAASADNTGLPGKSADLIVMGDSAHWIDASSSLSELRRILKPEGRTAFFARFWSQESPLTEKTHELLLKECEEYAASSTQLLRDVKNLRKRLGRHLVNEEENAWRGYSFVQAYSQDELVNFFKSCSFTSTSVAKNETSFREKVIVPLWNFAAAHDLLTQDGKLKVPYEVNALYGPLRKRISLEKETSNAARF